MAVPNREGVDVAGAPNREGAELGAGVVDCCGLAKNDGCEAPNRLIVDRAEKRSKAQCCVSRPPKRQAQARRSVITKLNIYDMLFIFEQSE